MDAWEARDLPQGRGQAVGKPVTVERGKNSVEMLLTEALGELAALRHGYDHFSGMIPDTESYVQALKMMDTQRLVIGHVIERLGEELGRLGIVKRDASDWDKAHEPEDCPF